MPDLPRRHQTKQGPCRLRGGRERILEALIVESVTGGILAPAPVLILNRDQPGHGLAKPGVLMVDPSDVERAQRRPRAVIVVHHPAALPRSLLTLCPAHIGNSGHNRL